MNMKPTMSTAVVSLAAVLAATVVGAGVAIIHLESDATQLTHEVSAESVALHHLQGEISSRSNGGLAQTVTTLKGEVATLRSGVATLQTEESGLHSGVGSLQASVSGLSTYEGDITALDGLGLQNYTSVCHTYFYNSIGSRQEYYFPCTSSVAPAG